MADRRFSDVGGTPGGLGDFLLGFALTCVGAYLLTNQVTVAGSYWNFWGNNTFGITLIPMLIGIGLLFRDGHSIIGWLLTAAGALFILGGVLANLHIYFQPTSLFNTIVMLVLLVGGLGLIARAILPHSAGGA
jgi:hypothetical protein